MNRELEEALRELALEIAQAYATIHQQEEGLAIYRADTARNMRALRECAALLGDRTPVLAQLILAGDPAQEAA